jgi:putative Holliday junction resolvase
LDRWMCLDIGDRRIGVAISDGLGITAQGITVYQRISSKEDLHCLSQQFKELEATGLVVGLPRNMNGTLGPQAESVQKFAQMLGKACGVEPVFWDERLTTVQATQVLLQADLSRKKRKTVVDQLSAVLILQSFLDAGLGKRS